MLDTNPQWPYFSRNVADNSSARTLDGIIKQHLTCERMLARDSTNPFGFERHFQLVFFETLDEKNAAGETTWKIGELFEDPTVVTNESDTRPFRRSAFSVRDLH